jgi:2-keto-4-pentenoate hydratase
VVRQRRPLEDHGVVRDETAAEAVAANRQVVDVRRTHGADDVAAEQARPVDDRLPRGRPAQGERLAGKHA